MCVIPSTADALTTIDSAEDKGYCKFLPLEEAVAAHLLPPLSRGLNAAEHSSKPCRMTSALANRANAAAGHAGSTLHTMSVLQVFQAKFLWDMDESGRDPGAFTELRTATDLALHATTAMMQTVGKTMASLVVLEHHLWLNFMDIRDSKKMAFLDYLVFSKGLFLSVPAWRLFQAAPSQRPHSSLQRRHSLSSRTSRNLTSNNSAGRQGGIPS